MESDGTIVMTENVDYESFKSEWGYYQDGYYIVHPITKKFKTVMILGYGRHGKDTAADFLSKNGYTVTSSSEYAARNVVFPVLVPIYGYMTATECFEDRHNHRKEWFDIITEYNRDDRGRLTKNMLSDGYDVYIGLRNKEELEAVRHLYDLIIWVDATKRIGCIEDEESCTITPDMADIIIDNNGSVEQLEHKLRRVFL